MARSSPTDADQSRVMPSGPPQAWVIVDVAQLRKQVAQGLAQHREHTRFLVEVRAHPRTEVVRRTAASEGEAAVGCALAVDDHVPAVAERRPAGQADRLPHRRGERLGGHHQ